MPSTRPIEYPLAQSTDHDAFTPLPITPSSPCPPPALAHEQKKAALAAQSAEAIHLRAHVLDAVRSRADHIPEGGSGKLEGKVGAITGVGPESGIGTAAAKLFAREGAAHIYLIDYTSTPIPSLLSSLTTTYPRTKFTFLQADAADPTAISSLINQALSEEGRFDFFFANAGVSQIAKFEAGKNGSLMSFIRPVEAVEEAEFDEVMRINALGAFVAIKYAAGAMSKLCPEKGKTIPGGSIVLTASVAGLKANAGPIPYSAAKAAVISMAQTSAFAFTGLNIRVNAVCPGLIETNMTKSLFELAKANQTTNRIGVLNPTLRQGLGFEVAHTALFLVSDDSSYVNGQAIPVDGGLSAGVPYVRNKI
ncbi:2,4-dienoyl-CoA reductase [Cryptococcus wingfieldii CBS 7118]|uniref:2,4-dienoyl-CoA reductase n=1 Tax=Cryptococcus wingfieldii CBS 7118 TaxID=1295528 RepID=A0A1E3J3Y1_9TREE|nr:2,4-dienoyl-CoA reductase [Cryptococcus wingfieldii CBS 7118]ODN94661.1 2,4-dienoyl-CoA reductase [Cryptococcus wingfieldii CBS 7118]